MAKQIPELSKAEWLVMNECWRRGRCTARQIFEDAPARRSWSYQTVKTILKPELDNIEAEPAPKNQQGVFRFKRDSAYFQEVALHG